MPASGSIPFFPNNLENLVSTVVAARNRATRWDLCSPANAAQKLVTNQRPQEILYPTSVTAHNQPHEVESVSHVNIVKKIKIDGDWKLLAIPRNAKGNYDWNALPDGLYLIEWRAGGKRRRESAGVTAAQALEAQRRKRHELEGRKLGVPGFELAGEKPKTPALHIAVQQLPRANRGAQETKYSPQV